jgi:hypothetical protein
MYRKVSSMPDEGPSQGPSGGREGASRGLKMKPSSPKRGWRLRIAWHTRERSRHRPRRVGPPGPRCSDIDLAWDRRGTFSTRGACHRARRIPPFP